MNAQAKQSLKQSLSWQTELVSMLDTLPGHDIDWLSQYRSNALDQFVKIGFPTRKTEAWKYVSTYAIAQITPQISPALSQSNLVDSAQIAQWRLDDCDEIVFVDGMYHAGLSSIPNSSSITIKNLAELLANSPIEAKALLSQASDEANDAPDTPDTFDALNQALLRDGVIITIADNSIIERPLHCLFVSTNTKQTITPINNWIFAGKNSQCSIVESYVGNDDTNNLTLSRTNIKLAANSELNHYRCQRESKLAYHLAELHVEQARDSRFNLYPIALGSAIARVNIQITLAEHNALCTVNGLYLTQDKQVSDCHIKMHHAVAHCTSNQLFKGVIDGASRAVFNGLILVDKDAQKTQADLSNRNLLLSKLADINTKPELEIYADDVKCSHGATIGQLDEQAIFYLQSRGVSREHARHLLMVAFINDVVDRISLDSLRKQIASLIIGRLPDSEFIREFA
ncbi:MAG: Fe-S cluster assembly protein SufD [Gammaproteobacteria bacterium]|nr:Fe-S cluster assembly protein SufD [Gammaproteobacteria bacterium]